MRRDQKSLQKRLAYLEEKLASLVQPELVYPNRFGYKRVSRDQPQDS